MVDRCTEVFEVHRSYPHRTKVPMCNPPRPSDRQAACLGKQRGTRTSTSTQRSPESKRQHHPLDGVGGDRPVRRHEADREGEHTRNDREQALGTEREREERDEEQPEYIVDESPGERRGALGTEREREERDEEQPEYIVDESPGERRGEVERELPAHGRAHKGAVAPELPQHAVRAPCIDRARKLLEREHRRAPASGAAK